MIVNKIVSELSKYNGHFPEQALITAREEWPLLLTEIKSALDRAIIEKEFSEEDENFLFWAILLLGDRKETSCLERVVKFCDQNDDYDSILENVLGDALTEELPSILSILANGKPELLNNLLLSSHAGEYVKVGILRVFADMVSRNVITRDYFSGNTILWINIMLAKEQSFALSYLGQTLIDLKLQSFQSMYLDFCEKGYIDYLVLPKEDIEQWYYEGCGVRERDICDSFDVMIVKTWASFQERRRSTPIYNIFKGDSDYLEDEPYIAPHLPKRNEPCFCGSGKKYKKCCLN